MTRFKSVPESVEGGLRFGPIRTVEHTIPYNTRVKRWMVEKNKMRTMVREKKKLCWQEFFEENGEKDP